MMYSYGSMPDGAEVLHSGLIVDEETENQTVLISFQRNGQAAECVLPIFEWTRMDDEFEDSELALYEQYLKGEGGAIFRHAREIRRAERKAAKNK